MSKAFIQVRQILGAYHSINNTDSPEVTSQKVLKKLAYYTLIGGHSKKLFLNQNFVLILNLQTLEFYLYPNSSYCKKQIDILDG